MQLRAILTSITLASSFLLSAPTAAQTRPDDVIVDMAQAFKRGDRKKLTALLPQARGHILEPWAAYWEQRARLDELTAQDMQAFSARFSGSYQEDRLRNDWLLLLGQRRDWMTFADEHARYRMNDDREVRCYALLIDQVKATPSQPLSNAAVEEVRKNWFAQRDGDDGCTQAADRLITARRLSASDAWRKARLSVENNRPRAARTAVGIVAPDAVGMLAELLDSPARFLNGKTLAVTGQRRELVTLALIKMASNDPDAAATQLEGRWGTQLTAEERNWVWGVIGKQAGLKLSPNAWSYFANITRDTDLIDDTLGWKVRSALRFGKWKEILPTIQAMSDEARLDSTWVYWRARALQQTRREEDRAEAAKLFESIAGVRGFYEQLALEETGQKIVAPTRPAPIAPEERDAARANPGLQRALYAIALGLRTEGVREWNYTTTCTTPAA